VLADTQGLGKLLYAALTGYWPGTVGFHHKTLASLLQAFATAGLTIRAVREFSVPGHAVLPWTMAFVAEKTG
jgi:hypothetical protein